MTQDCPSGAAVYYILPGSVNIFAGRERPLSPISSKAMCPGAEQLSLRPFSPCLGNSPPVEERPPPLQVSPLGGRHSSPGQKQPLPLQDARADLEPRLRNPAALRRVNSTRTVIAQPASTANTQQIRSVRRRSVGGYRRKACLQDSTTCILIKDVHRTPV